MEQVSVASLHRWGKLIKTWATGKSYFANDADPVGIEELPIPRTIAELQAQARRVGARVTIPDNVKGLAVIQYSPDTLVIRLPPKERIEATEARLGQSNAYPFPDFYGQFLNRELSADERMEVHACRIGDYTISMCG